MQPHRTPAEIPCAIFLLDISSMMPLSAQGLLKL
jgi:hypothetical protein